MGYEVIHTAAETVIILNGLKVKVSTDKPAPGTAFALGTLYKDDGSFSAVQVYQFLSINEQADAQSLKKLAAFFFGSLLNTEHYLIEISRDSALFPQEAARIFGNGNYERAI